MNDQQTVLYNQLMQLCASNEAFFFKDTHLDDKIYRVLTYRLASYSDFILPGARECRGIMFEVDSTGNPIRLACWTPSKFFNKGENPIVMDIEYNNDTVEAVMDKMDGSIISTFIHNGELRLKSKTSLFSDHVAAATEYLNQNQLFKQHLTTLTMAGFSVHMELTSPILRIVLGYEEVGLTILSIRNTSNGNLITKTNICQQLDMDVNTDFYQTLMEYWVPEFYPEDVQSFLASVPAMTGVEGYVIRMKDGEHVKVKCDWYCVLHHTKDSVSAPRRLFECIINEAADDLKAMFSEDPITYQRIVDMETKVVRKYNEMSATVDGFYQENKNLDRKSYAIKAQSCDDNLMGLKMNLYLGKTNDMKAFALKHPEMFNINVEEVYPDGEE